jgi:hypothetical protein
MSIAGLQRPDLREGLDWKARTKIEGEWNGEEELDLEEFNHQIGTASSGARWPDRYTKASMGQ